VIEDWRIEYNGERIHSSLGDITPRSSQRRLKPYNRRRKMTGNTAMRGEKIYEMDLDLTGVTDFGVSMDAITSNPGQVVRHCRWACSFARRHRM
jgi:hypothetical protein